MAFWGVEVKPGRPYTHAPSNGATGRLHVSQATLGAEMAPKRMERVVYVQCNVGDKSPVYLCAFALGKQVSCPVNIQFEEDDDVVFSVIGSRSVHLSGYYCRSSRGPNDDSEPVGEDIADTETEQSLDGSNEDEYEDSFIDDDEPEVFSPSPVSSDGDVEKAKNWKGTRKWLKKKQRSRESNDTELQQTFDNHVARVILSDSDNDDKFPIASLNKAKPPENGTTSHELKDDADDIGVVDGEVDASMDCQLVRQDDQETRQSMKEENENGTMLKQKTKQVSKEQKPTMSKCEDDPGLKCAKAPHGAMVSDQLDPNPTVNKEDHGNANDKGDSLPQVVLLSNDQVSADMPLSKKKRKKKINDEAKNALGCDSDNKSQQGEAKAINALKHDVQQSGETKKRADDGMSDGDPEHSGEVNNSEQKKKRRKRKIQENVDGNKASTTNKEVNGVDKELHQTRTSLDGLIMEDLEMGKPDSEVAVLGKKVTIHYTVRAKKEGQRFDLGADGDSLKFRLGRGKVIRGLDIGIEGMRVGDKRRLIIPPSLGYGSEWNGIDVPPDLWLVYDVRLLKVR